MELVTDRQRQMLRDALRDLAAPVRVLYCTPDVASAATYAERALLEEVARASDRIHLEVRAERWDAAREAEVGIARTPAIVLRSDKDVGIRYYGAPDGYELETFVAVLRAVADGRSGLGEAARRRVGELTRRLHVEVLVAPT